MNTILFLIMMISCKENETNPQPINIRKYFNEHKSGFEKDTLFLVKNITENRNISIVDTTLEYHLTISKTDPYNNTRELVIYRKSNTNSICIGIIDVLSIHNFEENNLESVQINSDIWGTVVEQQHKDQIESYISAAYELTSCIMNFDDWNSWQDGGYSIKLRQGTNYFTWSNDYISNDCKIQIQKLWESLNNEKMFIGLKKARLLNTKITS